ncbi:unnamed protein product [Knipowitschia caucasica]
MSRYGGLVCIPEDSPNLSGPDKCVTSLLALLLLICPSSYKTRADNWIGPVRSCSGIVLPQQRRFRPNFPLKNGVGGDKDRLEEIDVFCQKFLVQYLRGWVFDEEQ